MQSLKNNNDMLQAQFEDKKSNLDAKNRELNMTKLELKNFNTLKLEVIFTT